MKFILKILIVSIFALSIPFSEALAKKPGSFNVFAAAKLGYSAHFLSLKNQTTSASNNDILSSFNIGASVGAQYYFLHPFGLRLEFEYLYRTNDKTKRTNAIPTTASFTLETIMTNLYFDWHITTKAVIYTSAGIGASFTRVDFESPVLGDSKFDTNFVWSTGVGAWYAITENVIIDTNIRYVGYQGSSGQNLDITYLSGLDVIVSVRYLF